MNVSIQPTNSLPSLDGRRILVVDDDLADIMASALRNAGADVTAALDGIEGLKALENRRFDLVVLNYKMPRMNGAEVLREMRSGGDATPVLFVSAWALDEIAEPIHDLEFSSWLEKPFLMNRLVDKVRSALTLQSHS